MQIGTITNQRHQLCLKMSCDLHFLNWLNTQIKEKMYPFDGKYCCCLNFPRRKMHWPISDGCQNPQQKQPKQIVEKLYATQKVLSFLYNSFLALIFYYLYLYFSKEETEAAVEKIETIVLRLLSRLHAKCHPEQRIFWKVSKSTGWISGMLIRGKSYGKAMKTCHYLKLNMKPECLKRSWNVVLCQGKWVIAFLWANVFVC